MLKVAFLENWEFNEVGNEVRSISLPHDAMLEKGRKADALTDRSGAFFCGGSYQYRKNFFVPTDWMDKQVYIEFEGVYPNACVSLNGEEVGRCVNGYKGFINTLSGLKYGEENTIEVFVDHENLPDSRWYTGSGIYRPVWLWIGDKVHIEPKSLKITTKSIDPAIIEVVSTYNGNVEDLEVMVEIYEGPTRIAMEKGEKVELLLPEAKLWSDEIPYLYQCKVSLIHFGNVLDTETVPFGIRKIEWSVKGLLVNGKNTLLKGGCIHHDHGILGARCYSKSEYRRLKRLKEFGFNAIRSAHNPLSESALEACDQLGLYVMDEAWDMWYKSKSQYDYSQFFDEQYKEDLKAMVEKDYNHPSVIMYSIGNEVTEPSEERGNALGREMVDLLHQLDATRPVSAGINLTLLFMAARMNPNPNPNGNTGTESNQMQIPDFGKMDSTTYNKMMSEMGSRMNQAAATDAADEVSTPILDAVDIAGYNYASSRYEMEKDKHPNRIIVGSETYTYEIAKNWEMVEKIPYLIGDFMWTAWDYLGEVGIGAWTYDESSKGFEKKYPWLLADTGAFDILGNDNAQAGLAAIVWGKRKVPYIGVVPVNQDPKKLIKAIWRGSNALPYWSYRGCDGREAEVEVYADAYEIELLLNNQSQGRKKLEYKKAVFSVVYEEGILRAIAYDQDGRAISESSLQSADIKTEIQIQPEGTHPGKDELIYVDIIIAGENGEVECNQDQKLKVKVQGGELLAFGSGNPRTEESYLSGEFTTYYGKAQAIVKCKEDQVEISVVGEALDEKKCVINRMG